MRSKIKVTDEESAPGWSLKWVVNTASLKVEALIVFCFQCKHESPVYSDYLVMCQVQSADHTTHPSNTRAAAAEVVTDEWWFDLARVLY